MTSSANTNPTLERQHCAPRDLQPDHTHVLTLDAHRRHPRYAGQRQATVRQTSAHEQTTIPAADNRLEAQLKHELALAYTDLGGATFALAHHGALNDRRLAPRVQRIYELTAQLDALTHDPERLGKNRSVVTAC